MTFLVHAANPEHQNLAECTNILRGELIVVCWDTKYHGTMECVLPTGKFL
jgi:hypothetical protein